MDITLTAHSLRKFLETPASHEEIAQKVSLCGPTFDRHFIVDDESVYQIEIITNRIDTASAQGVAREAAAILKQFDIPAKFINNPYEDRPQFSAHLPQLLHFKFDRDLAVRFMAVSLENISVKPSPPSIQKLLQNSGQKPLNNCIDITNELTLHYGMPSHIFDLDKLGAQSLNLRLSSKNETITTLDHQTSTLRGGDLVIEDGTHRLIDLCGVMGGQLAMVDSHTKSILLIVPVYQPQKVRQTSLYLQKRTLAAQIYEKQPDPELCPPVIAKAIQLFKERAGAEVSSSIFDYYPTPHRPKSITLDFNWLNSFVGISFPPESVSSILKDLGFGVTATKEGLACTIPSWRSHDINLREDLAEEVARIYGYYRLPSVMPPVFTAPEPANLLLNTEARIKKYLADTGFHEIYNSSLVSQTLLESTFQNSDQNLKLKNALSLDYQYLRTSLLPSLLENHKHNRGKLDGPVKTFEIANCYQKLPHLKLPNEVSTLAILSTDTYRQTKGVLETLLSYLRVKDVSYQIASESPSLFRPDRTAAVYSGRTLLGYLGELQPQVLRNIGLDSSPTAVEINLPILAKHLSLQPEYLAISDYPPVVEDITLSSSRPLGDIIKTIQSSSKLINSVKYLDTYQQKHTFRVTFGSQDKNLKQAEINTLKDIIQDHFKV